MTLRESLSQVDLFKALPDAALDEIMGSGTSFSLNPGTALVIEGSLGHGLPDRQARLGDGQCQRR